MQTSPSNRRFLLSAARVFPAATVVVAVLGASVPLTARAQTVKVPGTRMSLVPPPGAQIVTAQTPGALAKHNPGWVMDVVSPAAVGGFRTNFNVRTGVAEPNAVYNLNTASKMSEQFKQGFPSARNIAFSAIKVGGVPAVSILGTVALPKQPIRTKIVQFAHAGTRYTLTFTSAENAFYRQVGVFDKVVASVRLQ